MRREQVATAEALEQERALVIEARAAAQQQQGALIDLRLLILLKRTLFV